MYLQLAAMGSTARGAAHHGIDIAGASFALQAPHPVSACPRISGSPGAPVALRGSACRLLFKHPGEVTGPRACSPSFPPGVRAGPRAPPILFCPNAGRAALGRQAGKKGPRDPSRYSSSLLRGTTEPTLRSWDQPLAADPSSPEFGVCFRTAEGLLPRSLSFPRPKATVLGVLSLAEGPPRPVSLPPPPWLPPSSPCPPWTWLSPVFTTAARKDEAPRAAEGQDGATIVAHST